MTQSQSKNRKVHFRFKNHPGDLFRDASIQPLPNPEDEQETFWIWFHPCFQISDDVSELNDLYKILHDEEFDEDFKTDNSWYGYYTGMSKEEIQGAIAEYEQEITRDCLENFYRLVRNGEVEIVERDS